MANRPKIAGRNRINQLSRSNRVDNTFLRASDLEDVMDYLDENIRPYKVYSALLSQSGTDAPTAIVLENTLGVVTYGYISEGGYTADLTGEFINDKTYVSITQTNISKNFMALRLSADQIRILVVTISGFTGKDDALNKTPFEIRVYS